MMKKQPGLNLKTGIKAIMIKDKLTPMIVGENCDEIKFCFSYVSYKVWYEIIGDGVFESYLASQIEKVFYNDNTIEKATF